MLEHIELEQLPTLLQEAVHTNMRTLSQSGRIPCEIISMTRIDFDRPESPGQKRNLYRAIFLIVNTFVVLEQTTNSGYDFGVSQSMLTIGTIQEIMNKAPTWTGLKCG